MFKKTKTIAFAAGALSLLTATSANAQHAHINAGVFDTDNSGTANAGDKLGFKNGDEFAYDFNMNSGYIKNATFSTVGTYATHYGHGVSVFSITPTGLAGDSGRNYITSSNSYRVWEPFIPTANGNLAVGGAHSGSWLNMEIVSVELLSGSALEFSFWDAGATSPTGRFTFSGPGTGIADGTNIWNLTVANNIIGPGGAIAMEGATYGSITPVPLFIPGYANAFSSNDTIAGFGWNETSTGNIAAGDHGEVVDPYGHVHGRRWVADGNGEFKIIFRLTDANGVHTSSDDFAMKWSAVPEPATGLIATIGVSVIALGRRRSS